MTKEAEMYHTKKITAFSEKSQKREAEQFRADEKKSDFHRNDPFFCSCWQETRFFYTLCNFKMAIKMNLELYFSNA